MMKSYFIVDAHCDTMGEIAQTGEEFLHNHRHLCLDKMLDYQGYIQVFAAWIDEKQPNSLSEALKIIDKFYLELEKNSDKMQFICDKTSLYNVLQTHKMGAILSIEDARAICGSLPNLRMLYKLGVRIMTLAWNNDNDVTYGTFSKEGKGLTEFGEQVVREMNRIGMIVDVSHITEAGFWDVLNLTTKPVIASHSNAYSVCAHPRNLTDDQIIALIRNNGMIGINIYPMFLNLSQNAAISDIIHHIEHFLCLGAENHIGLGTDFDGVPVLPQEIQNAGTLYKLFDEMIRLGYNNEIIERVTHQNFIDFFQENL